MKNWIRIKRLVLKWTFDLNNSAGQIIDGRWRAGDIISHELRRVNYVMEIGRVAIVDGEPDDETFTTATANTPLNAIKITITPRTSRIAGASELAYLRRVYRAYLPLRMYVLPINLEAAARVDITGWATIENIHEKEVMI